LEEIGRKLFKKSPDFFGVFWVTIDEHSDYSVASVALGFDSSRNKSHKLNGSSRGLMSAVICGTKYHSFYVGMLFQFLSSPVGLWA